MFPDARRSSSPVVYCPLQTYPDMEEIRHQEQLLLVIHAQELYARRNEFPEVERLHKIYVEELGSWLAEYDDQDLSSAGNPLPRADGSSRNGRGFDSYWSCEGGVYSPEHYYSGHISPTGSFSTVSSSGGRVPLALPQLDGTLRARAPRAPIAKNPLASPTSALSQKIYEQALHEYASEPYNNHFRPRTNPSTRSLPGLTRIPMSPQIPIITSYPPILEGESSRGPRDFSGGEIIRVLAHKQLGSSSGLLYCILWKSKDPGVPATSWWVSLKDMVGKKSFIDDYHLRHRMGPVPWPSSGKRRRPKSSVALGVREIKNTLMERKAELVSRGAYEDDVVRHMSEERWKMREEWQRMGRGWGAAKQVVESRKRLWRLLDERKWMITENRAAKKGKQRRELLQEASDSEATTTPPPGRHGISKHKSLPALRVPLANSSGLRNTVVSREPTVRRNSSSVTGSVSTIRAPRAKCNEQDQREWKRFFGSSIERKRKPNRAETSSSSSRNNGLSSESYESLLEYSATTVAMLKHKAKKRSPPGLSQVKTTIMNPRASARMRSTTNIANLDGTENTRDSDTDSMTSAPASPTSTRRKKEKNPPNNRHILTRLFGNKYKDATPREQASFYTGEGDDDAQRGSTETVVNLQYPAKPAELLDSYSESSVVASTDSNCETDYVTKTPNNSVASGASTPSRIGKIFALSTFLNVFEGAKSTYSQSESGKHRRSASCPRTSEDSRLVSNRSEPGTVDDDDEDVVDIVELAEAFHGKREARMWLDGADESGDIDGIAESVHVHFCCADDMCEYCDEEFGFESISQLDGSHGSVLKKINISPAALYQSCITNFDYIESASMVSNTTAASTARSDISEHFADGPDEDGLYTLHNYTGLKTPSFVAPSCGCRAPLICANHLNDWRDYLATLPDGTPSKWTHFYKRVRDRHRRERRRMLEFLRSKSKSYRDLKAVVNPIGTLVENLHDLPQHEFDRIMKERFEDYHYAIFTGSDKAQEDAVLLEKKARVFEQTKRLQELMFKELLHTGRKGLTEEEEGEKRYLQRRCAKRRRLEWNEGYEVARAHARQGKLVID